MAAALAMALTFLDTPAGFFPSPFSALFAIAAFVVPGGLPRPLFTAGAASSFSFTGVFAPRAGVVVASLPRLGVVGFFAPPVDFLLSRASGSFVNALVDFCVAERNKRALVSLSLLSLVSQSPRSPARAPVPPAPALRLQGT